METTLRTMRTPSGSIIPIRTNAGLSVVAEEDYSDSVMICLKPSDEVAKMVAGIDGATNPAEEMHITLFYLGTTEEAGGDPGRERIFRGLYDLAIHSGYRGLTGKLNGFGVFLNDDANVLVSLWDIPGIAEFRTHVGDYIKRHGGYLREDTHGFTPHMTLDYPEKFDGKMPSLPADNPERVVFASVWLVWGEDWQEVPLA